MAKAKIKKVIEEETDVDLPIYLYFQGEMLDEEYIKWDGEVCTRVVFGFKDITIESSNYLNLREHDLKRLTQAEVFEEEFNRAINIIKERL